MEKKKLPIGIQDFQDFHNENYLYVDKTEDIYRLLTMGKNYFLSRPRRFGKSLLISTMKAIFQGRKNLFEGLWIYDKWDWSKSNPVIHLSFAISAYKEIGLVKSILTLIDSQAAEYGITLTG